MASISTFAITKISTDGSLDTFQWISSSSWKQILQGACSSPRLQYLRDYGVLPLLIDNPLIPLCHSQFYVFLGHSSPVSVCCMVPRLSCLLTCHNNVIDAGQTNRLFAPGTDMDRERLRLSYMQQGTHYVQICDNEGYGLWCFTTLFTVFQLYSYYQFYWWGKPESLTNFIT